jgi:uncharacterized protein
LTTTRFFKSFLVMKLPVERLTTTPRELGFQGDAAFWAELGERDDELAPRLLRDVHIQLRAHKMGEDVYLEGEAETELECGCSRCLARYRLALREPFRIVLEPASGRVPADPEAAKALARDGVCLGDELDAGWYRGSEIDLRHYLREVVALALPVQPLCREDCRGLCPHCGADRNVETCSCAKASPDSPFAVLRKLQVERGD